MPRRILALILASLLVASPIFAEAQLSYEPYGEDEFPIWTMKLRRAESLFFGSMVLTVPIAMLGWTLMDAAGWIPEQSPIASFGWQMLITGGLSAGIATADWIIGEVQEG